MENSSVGPEIKSFHNISVDNDDFPHLGERLENQSTKMSSRSQDTICSIAGENKSIRSKFKGFCEIEDKKNMLTGPDESWESHDFRPRSKTLSELGKARRKQLSWKGLQTAESWKQPYAKKAIAKSEAQYTTVATDCSAALKISLDDQKSDLKQQRENTNSSVDAYPRSQSYSEVNRSSVPMIYKEIRVPQGEHHVSTEEIPKARKYENERIDGLSKEVFNDDATFLRNNLIFQGHNRMMKNSEFSMESVNSDTESCTAQMRKRSYMVSVPNARKRFTRLKVNVSFIPEPAVLKTKSRLFVRKSSDLTIPDLTDQTEFRQRSYTMADSSSVRKMREKLNKRLNVSLQSSLSSNSDNQTVPEIGETGSDALPSSVLDDTEMPILEKGVAIEKTYSVTTDMCQNTKDTYLVGNSKDLHDIQGEELVKVSSFGNGEEKSFSNYDRSPEGRDYQMMLPTDQESISLEKGKEDLDEIETTDYMTIGQTHAPLSFEPVKAYNRDRRLYQKRRTWCRRSQHRNLSPCASHRDRVLGGDVQRKSKVFNAFRSRKKSLFSKLIPDMSDKTSSVTTRTQGKTQIPLYLEEKCLDSPSYVLRKEKD